MRVDIAGLSDIGRRKKKNEDSYGVYRDDAEGLRLFRNGTLLCVADGLGGHVGGEIASRLAVSILRDMLKEPPPPAEVDGEEGLLALLKTYTQKANESIFQTNKDQVREGRPMGTTLLTALIIQRKIYIANVGDSRCYHIRDGDIIEHTEDHSWVDEQVKLGLMTRSEAETDNRKNMVTRSVGTHPEVEIDTYKWHIVPGDTLLLCTDGLINMVKDSVIIEEFRKNASPAEIAQRLVKLANENGGKDNITVVIADVEPSQFTMLRRRLRLFLKTPAAKGLYYALLVLYGLAAAGFGYWLRGAGIIE